MLSRSHRIGFVSLLGLSLAGCYDGGASEAAETDGAGTAGTGADGDGTVDDGDGTVGDDESAGDDANTTVPLPDPPPDCLPGAVGCECLDGGCEGLGTCEDNICIPGPPVPEVDGNGQAIAGVAISLNGDIDDDDNLAGFDQLEWSQVEGPDAMIMFELGTDALAYLPDDAPVGMEFVFRLSATLGDVATSADYTVTIIDANASGPMDEGTDAVALAGSAFSPAGDNDYWIGTATGNFARIDDNAVSAEYDLMSPIADIVGYPGGLVLIAQPDIQTITEFNANNNQSSDFLTEQSGGNPLGGVSVMAVDGDDNIYIGTAEGDVLFYNSPEGAEPATTTVVDTLGTIPTAFALGDVVVEPEDDENDEGNVLYIGTVNGDVMQIGLSAPEDGSPLDIGSVTSYLSVPGSGPVTGLTVDGVGNMWVGKSSGIYLVRRVAGEGPQVVRTIAPTSGLEGYSGMRVNDGRLVWIDSASGRIGSMITINN